MMPLSQSEKDDLDFRLGVAFKPTMPINREDLFQGRQSQAKDVLDAINQNGQHVILYGERGVGKTSLANMIFFRVGCPAGHLITPHINCNSQSTYGDIWGSLLIDLQYRATKQTVVLPRSVKKLIRDVQDGKLDFSPDHAQRLCAELWGKSILTVLIVDEFDTLADVQTRQMMAETIKCFSDRNTPSTFVLIGVADDVESLIARHQSVERCVREVRMPRMSRDEIEDIISNTLNSVQMGIESDALQELSRIAIGLPHYAHLLGLQAGRQAVSLGVRLVNLLHVNTAFRNAIAMAQVTIHNAYNRATMSAKKNALYKQVLLACALAETDSFGYFAPTDVRSPLERILGRSYAVEAFARHLHAFSDPERGPVFKTVRLMKHPRFRFQNPLMQPFVLMKGLDEGDITDADLRDMRDPKDPQGRLF